MIILLRDSPRTCPGFEKTSYMLLGAYLGIVTGSSVLWGEHRLWLWSKRLYNYIGISCLHITAESKNTSTFSLYDFPQPLIYIRHLSWLLPVWTSGLLWRRHLISSISDNNMIMGSRVLYIERDRNRRLLWWAYGWACWAPNGLQVVNYWLAFSRLSNELSH